MNTYPSRRRWFQFGMGTMLVVVVLIAIGAWLLTLPPAAVLTTMDGEPDYIPWAIEATIRLTLYGLSVALGLRL
ncbi:MAG: hypothetical protein HYX69_00080 [Planctomycetia bacterium]|nr:hypothetical protein [Planctomycetia bacterium]